MTAKQGEGEAPAGGGQAGAEAGGARAPRAAAPAGAAPRRPPEAPERLADQPWFRRLVEGANAGDRKALAELRKFLDKHPEFWRRAGDLTAAAERAWVGVIAGPGAVAAESVARSVAAMKGSLAGPCPTALEALLVDQITVSWLAARHAEVQAAGPPEGSLGQAAMRLRRAESSQRRFLAAARALATLRQLAPAGLAPIGAPRLHEPSHQAV